MLRHGFIASLLLIGSFVLLTTLTSINTMAERPTFASETLGRYLSPTASLVTLKAARCMRSCRSINQKQSLSWGQSCSRVSRTRTNNASSGSSSQNSLRALTASEGGATCLSCRFRRANDLACRRTRSQDDESRQQNQAVREATRLREVGS